jgi:hypothetical protein
MGTLHILRQPTLSNRIITRTHSHLPQGTLNLLSQRIIHRSRATGTNPITHPLAMTHSPRRIKGNHPRQAILIPILLPLIPLTLSHLPHHLNHTFSSTRPHLAPCPANRTALPISMLLCCLHQAINPLLRYTNPMLAQIMVSATWATYLCCVHRPHVPKNPSLWSCPVSTVILKVTTRASISAMVAFRSASPADIRR